MTTTEESTRPRPLIGPSAGPAEAVLTRPLTTIRTPGEITRPIRATFGTEES